MAPPSGSRWEKEGRSVQFVRQGARGGAGDGQAFQVMLQVGGGRARSLCWGGEEVTHAFFRELAVLVVVEGLAGQLAEEGRPVSAAAAAADDLVRAADELLCAGACG